MVDVFSAENAVKGNWVKFITVGDKFQGTYIGKRTALNQLSGKDQEIYEFIDEKGDVWNVGGKPGIDMQLRHINFGQIVGFEYVEERASKKVGMNASKIIQVYAKADLVDQKWLEQQAGGVASAAVASETAPAVEAAVKTDPEMLAEIAEIVKTKFGIEDPEKVKEKTMEETGLAFLPANLSKILEALK